MEHKEQVSTFSNGLDEAEQEVLYALRISLARTRLEIEKLGRHRTYSLAITKLEEAEHWLIARIHSAP